MENLFKKLILSLCLCFFFGHSLEQVRGLTDNNALNYRSGSTDRNETTEQSSSTHGGNRRDVERECSSGNGNISTSIDVESDRDQRECRIDDNTTIQEHRDGKGRDRDIRTHSDHSSNKRSRKNSSNCDNSLISSYNTNLQERHYSQDSQVI